MDKIYNIKYVDAYYSYAKKIGNTKLSVYEAYGYVEKQADNIVVIFIKKRGTSNAETIKNNENIVKGLVMPDTALVSVPDAYKTDILKNITTNSAVAVTFRDVVYVANMPRYDCSIMYTEGILFKIEKDHIVLKNPETIRMYPGPIKNHPVGKQATFLVVPISFIKDMEVI